MCNSVVFVLHRYFGWASFNMFPLQHSDGAEYAEREQVTNMTDKMVLYLFQPLLSFLIGDIIFISPQLLELI